MLTSKRIVTEAHRTRIISYLETFEGWAIVAPALGSSASADQHFSAGLRDYTIQRLQAEIGDERHLWIATDDRGSLYSLLHAKIVPGLAAELDLLCAAEWGYHPASQRYQGFGELQKLSLELEKRGMDQLRIPTIPAGELLELAENAWREQGQGSFHWEPMEQQEGASQ